MEMRVPSGYATEYATTPHQHDANNNNKIPNVPPKKVIVFRIPPKVIGAQQSSIVFRVSPTIPQKCDRCHKVSHINNNKPTTCRRRDEEEEEQSLSTRTQQEHGTTASAEIFKRDKKKQVVVSNCQTPCVCGCTTEHRGISRVVNPGR